jgi:hypothetical protein
MFEVVVVMVVVVDAGLLVGLELYGWGGLQPSFLPSKWGWLPW